MAYGWSSLLSLFNAPTGSVIRSNLYFQYVALEGSIFAVATDTDLWLLSLEQEESHQPLMEGKAGVIVDQVG